MIVVAQWCIIPADTAAQIDTAQAPPTHAEFIQQSLLTLVEEVLAGADTAGRQSLRVIPTFDDSTNHHVEAAFETFRASSGASEHVLHYNVYLWDFSLVRKTRRRLLGRFWVLRELRIGMTVEYPPALSIQGKSRADFDRTFSGWVRAADLRRLESREFSSLPVPPASDFVSRWATPAIVGVGLGALTFLFFSIR